MIVHTENPKESTKENFLELMSEFRRWQYKRSTHIQSHAYILTMKEKETETKMASFILTPKKMKYLGIPSTKLVQHLYG